MSAPVPPAPVSHVTEVQHLPEGRGMWRHTCGACDWATTWHGPDARRDLARDANAHTAMARRAGAAA